MEMLAHYDLEGNRLPDISRDEYYAKARKEWQTTGKISTAIATVRVLLVDPAKGMLLQKRSLTKDINPGMWDKSVAGHVAASESFDEACSREAQEEMGIHVTFVPREAVHGYKRSSLIQAKAVISYLGAEIEMVPKVFEDMGIVLFPVLIPSYYGYYSGPCHFADGEAVDARHWTMGNLLLAVHANSEDFVPEVHRLIDLWEEARRPSLDACYYRVSVKGLITDAEGRLLLLREQTGIFDLPGGGLDHGEDPVEGLKREIYEETGLKVLTIDSAPCYFTTVLNKKYGAVANLIYAATCAGDFVPSEECVEMCYLSKEELRRLPEEKMLPNLREFLRQYLGV